jgi:hypothetical protein
MASSPFDSDFSDTPLNDRIAPLWTLKDLDDDKKMLEWQNKTYETELKQIQKIRESGLKNIALFKGKFYSESAGRSGFAEASQTGLGLQSSKPSKLVVNHLFDLTTQRVARVTRNKPAVSVNPANSEYKDKVSARVMKYWVDYLLYQNDFDSIVAQCATNAYIIGESYIATRWDAEAGQKTEDWVDEEQEAEREGRKPRVALTDEDDNPIKGSDGEQMFVERAVYTGDVALECWTPLDTIVERCGDFKKAKYWFHEEYVDIDELRAMYTEQAEKLKPDVGEDAMSVFRDAAGYDGGPSEGKVLVRYFRHKPTSFLASGRFVVSTRTAILVNKPLAKNERGLGLARLTDIDVPKRQFGLSFYEHAKRINAAINDLTSMGMRNSKLMAHPKWILPRGSIVKKDALGNDITIVEYQGATPPQMVAPPPMNQELMGMKNDLKADIRIFGDYSVASGDIPPNIRSALALQYIDEQEEQRANSSVAKHAGLIKEVIQNAINIASAYYEKDDKRLLPVVGNDNRYLVKEFDPEHLTKSYDIRVANSSGLPQTKAARTEMLIALREAFPTMITDERAAELLQFSDVEGFYDSATAAVKAAQAENESMINGDSAASEQPTIFEDLIIHWSEHVKEVQNRSFKVTTPKEVQEKFVAHIGGTEYLMMERAKKNPAYAVKVMQLSLYPLIYEPSPEDFMLLDAARSGNPLSLVQIDILYKTGMLPPGMGAAPPAGGLNNGVPMGTAPGAAVVPEEDPTNPQPPGGALAGESTTPAGPVE